MIRQLANDYQTVMEPILYNEAFNDENYIYQLKWDGVRMLTILHAGQVYLINKHAHDRTLQYGELQQLVKLVDAHTAVLDGEVVVLKDGKPSFPAVMRRDGSKEIRTIEYLQEILPINYMVFDLLHLNGRDLRQETLIKRKAKLEQIIDNQSFLHLVEDFSEGITLFQAVDKMGMEGIVAKHKSGRYLPGKQHHDWLKIKCRRSQYCLIGGFTLRGRIVNALLLGVYREGNFSYAGKAASGLSYDQQEILSHQLPAMEIADSPFVNLRSTDPRYHFIKPEMGVKVEYLEWSEDLKLRAPVLKEFIRLKPEDCNV